MVAGVNMDGRFLVRRLHFFFLFSLFSFLSLIHTGNTASCSAHVWCFIAFCERFCSFLSIFKCLYDILADWSGLSTALATPGDDSKALGNFYTANHSKSNYFFQISRCCQFGCRKMQLSFLHPVHHEVTHPLKRGLRPTRAGTATTLNHFCIRPSCSRLD